MLLKLNDWFVQWAMREHGLKSKKRLGRGAFGVVFDNGDTVLKLTTDQMSYAYLTDPYAPKGAYVPKVIADHGNVGETQRGDTLYLLELEKLSRVTKRHGTYKLANQITKLTSKHRIGAKDWSGMAALTAVLETESGFDRSLREFMAELRDFVGNFSCALDFRIANFMERSDGSLVFNDPVFDRKRYDSVWKSQGWH